MTAALRDDLASDELVLETEEVEMSFALYRPIQRADGETVERVVFAEPNTGMLKVLDTQKGEIAKAIALVSKMTNLSLADVNALHPRDFARCQRIVGNFFGEFLSEAGPTP